MEHSLENAAAREEYKKIPAKDPRRHITPWSVLQDHFISVLHDTNLSLATLPRVATHLTPPQKVMMLLPSIAPAWVKVHTEKVAEFCCLPATLKQLLEVEAKAQNIDSRYWNFGNDSTALTHQDLSEFLRLNETSLALSVAHTSTLVTCSASCTSANR